MSNNPHVSILMNCRNGEQYVAEAIKSICSQTYRNWRILFVDNCSKDRSIEIAKSFKLREKLKIIETPKPMKLYEARNFGLNFFDGDCLAFLDIDDYWLPNKLEKQVPWISKQRGLLFTDFRDLYEVPNKLNNLRLASSKIRTLLKEQGFYSIENALNCYNFNLQTAIISQKCLADNRFNSDYDLIGDVEFFTRLSLSQNMSFYYLSDITAITRVHPNQLSNIGNLKWIEELDDWLNQKYIQDAKPEIIKAIEDMRHFNYLNMQIENNVLTIADLKKLKLNSPNRVFTVLNFFYRSINNGT